MEGVVCEDLAGIGLGHVRFGWRTLVNTVLNIWVAQMRGNFLDLRSQNQILSSVLLSY